MGRFDRTVARGAASLLARLATTMAAPFTWLRGRSSRAVFEPRPSAWMRHLR